MNIDQLKASINLLSIAECNELRDYIVKKSLSKKIDTIQELIDDYYLNISNKLLKFLKLLVTDYQYHYISELNTRELLRKNYRSYGAKTLTELEMLLKDINIINK
ncbi:MAG: hypothetical protein ACOYOV_10780 [Bacteroidales bacterium]